MMAGRSWGVRPTARANENSRESTTGLWKKTLTANTASTNTNVTSLSR